MKRLAALILIIYSSHAMAFNWLDLWLRADQQGTRLLQQNKPEQAAEKFTDKQWQGVAYFRAGHYSQAANHFQQLSNADSHYNRGNALALQGDYQHALDAYEQALKLQPEHADAKYNLEIVKKLMQQQNKNQQQSGNTNQQTDNQKNNDQNDKAQDNKTQPDKTDKDASTKDNNKPSKPDPTPPTAEKNKQNASVKQSETRKESFKQTQQANEQWLQQIPDDPGGLLKQKFLRDYQQRHAH